MTDSLEIDDTSPIRGAYFISINLQYKNCLNNTELIIIAVALSMKTTDPTPCPLFPVPRSVPVSATRNQSKLIKFSSLNFTHLNSDRLMFAFRFSNLRFVANFQFISILNCFRANLNLTQL